ncbi:MAG: DNA (cytosine-5-)-methyltransferase [Mariprofundaceae bacterium]
MSPNMTYEVLREVRKHFTQKEVANNLGVDTRTIKRWEARESSPPPYVIPSLQQLLPFFNKSPKKNMSDFKFIDLFAGIGGIRLGFEKVGGECVYTSEWNKYATQTYTRNFQCPHSVDGDITEINPLNIPEHDVLLAGFPCQPFSIAGVSKKNSLGRAHGFACEAQGTLFFDVANIIRIKRPKVFLLENVKNLQSHDKGNTFRVIKDTLEKELRYTIFPLIIDAKGFVPQHRERIYIVGFRERVNFDWDDFQHPDPKAKKMNAILHPENGSEKNSHDYIKGYTTDKNGKVNDKYILSEKLWLYLQGHAAKHKAKGNGFGFGLVNSNETSRTLSARYYKDGSEILVNRGEGNSPRRLTPRECARLMGYPDDFVIPVSDTQAYKQFGNSVVVPVISEIARMMKPFILELIEKENAAIQKGKLQIGSN